MTWAFQRQLFYVGIVLAFFLVLGFLIAYPYFNQAPTCFDSKQNGNETGVDCGGSCALACTAQVDPIAILWSRAFEVVPGRYNAIAYLENHNKSAVVNSINYKFRFADKDNLYIGKREGQTFVPPAGKFAVFEPAIGISNSIPVYTTFEFTTTPVWTQASPEKIGQIQMVVSNIKMENETTSPHLSATITNDSLFIVPEISVVAILYDATQNALSISRTYLDQLNGGESAQINFTWPEPIPGKVIAEEIIPMYNIFLAKLK